MNLILQQKMQENDVRREEERIEERVKAMQMGNDLAEAEAKIAVLEALLRKLKTGKIKNSISRSTTINEDLPALKEEPVPSDDKSSTCGEGANPNDLKPHRSNLSKTGTSVRPK